MNTNPQLSGLLAIIGQSGAGKGLAATIVKQLCEKRNIEIFPLATGDLVRSATATQTYFAKKLHAINVQGKKQPSFVVGAMWFYKLLYELQEGQLIVMEGAPRHEDQFTAMKELLEAGYIDSLKILEVLADEQLCETRLIERTKIDKREDLSINGQPGVPDINKIQTKMGWWTVERDKIITMVQADNCYFSVENNTIVESLGQQIQKILF